MTVPSPAHTATVDPAAFKAWLGDLPDTASARTLTALADEGVTVTYHADGGFDVWLGEPDEGDEPERRVGEA